MRQALLGDQRGGGSAHSAVQLTEVAVASTGGPLTATTGKGGWWGVRLRGVLIAVAGTGTGRGHTAGVRSVNGSRVWHLV